VVGAIRRGSEEGEGPLVVGSTPLPAQLSRIEEEEGEAFLVSFRPPAASSSPSTRSRPLCIPQQ
jgi:hypothetical protein